MSNSSNIVDFRTKIHNNNTLLITNYNVISLSVSVSLFFHLHHISSLQGNKLYFKLYVLIADNKVMYKCHQPKHTYLP